MPASRENGDPLTGNVIDLSPRLEFVTLDELEAGFADRLGADAVFLPRLLLGASADQLTVGTSVLVVMQTARGDRALAFAGVVSWTYPPAPRTPLGREPGAGIVIERVVDDETRARMARMRRRPGAGARVRAPGSRVPGLRLPSRLPPPSAPARGAPPAPPRLPASLLSDSLRLDNQPADDSRSPASIHARPHLESASLAEATERLPAAPRQVPRSVDSAPVDASRGASSSASLTTGKTRSGTPTSSGSGRAIALEELPDAPDPPQTGVFEQRLTDVDLLMSLDEHDVFSADEGDASSSSHARPSARLASLDGPASTGNPLEQLSNPALHEETIVSWTSSDDVVSADSDVQLVPELGDRIELVPLPPPPVVGHEVPHHLDEPTSSTTLATDAGSTGEGVLSPDELQSVDDVSFAHAEITAVVQLPALAVRSAETEHGPPVVRSTAEATASSDRSAFGAVRPLPTLEQASADVSGAQPEPIDIGVAFTVSHKRAHTGDHIAGLERVRWPKNGSKRWQALDDAREAGGDALGDALSSSPWLSRDVSMDKDVSSHMDESGSEPGLDVAAVVGQVMALAADDAVFSEASPVDDHPVGNVGVGDTPDRGSREGLAVLPLSPDNDHGEDPGELTVDESELSSLDGSETPDEEAPTDRALTRPPTKASAEAQDRLAVLQRYLTRPRNVPR